jgi:epoxyqueuosine reductase
MSPTENELTRKIKTLTEGCGVDFFGIADLTRASVAVIEQGGEELACYPFAVSMGIALPHSIVDQLPRRHERAVAVNYRLHCYDVINERLDLVSSLVAGALQREGYAHKLAAHLAGLGWIGKSCLLITPEAGPRVRWTSVLTDAPLGPAGAPSVERCGECSQCVDACPEDAFTGRPFREDEPREARYDARRCEAYHEELERAHGIAVCGMCIYACPFGQSKSASRRD